MCYSLVFVSKWCDVVLCQITGDGVLPSPAHVLSISEQTGLATVALLPPTDEEFQPCRFSDTVQVPISRLRAVRHQVRAAISCVTLVYVHLVYHTIHLLVNWRLNIIDVQFMKDLVYFQTRNSCNFESIQLSRIIFVGFGQIHYSVEHSLFVVIRTD